MSFQHFHITSKSSAWFPTNLPGCILWLDAGQGITKDGSNHISLFGDQSGQANNASQATGTNQPLWVDNQLNGKPIVRFDGSNDFMAFASGFLYNLADISFFIVFKPIISLNSGIFAPSNIYGTGIEFLSKGEIAEPIQLRINGTVKYTSGLFSDGTFTISDFTYNSAAANGYNNGVALTMAPGGGSLNFNGIYALGRYAGSYGSYYSAFDVAEIIIYDNTLSGENRIKVGKYLATKYGFVYDEFVDVIPTMTSNTSPLGIATSSNTIVGQEPYKAFDKNITTYWGSFTYGNWLPQWVAYEFPTAKIIKKYAVKAVNTADGGYNPKSWQFQGYDGANWVDLDIVVNEPQFGNFERREYSIDTPASYIKYRIYVTEAQSYAYTEIAELEMSE